MSIVSDAKQIREDHENDVLNRNAAKVKNIQIIANRFTQKKRTNVQSIKNINRVVQYMLCAKIVGDRRLYKDLNDYTDGVLDKYFENIEIEDNCYDGFDRAVDRHLYRFNKDVYEYLHERRIKFVDAGLVQHNGNDIFLPAYNAIINVRNNRRCLEELDEFVKSTPEEDRHNEEFSWERKVIKKFIIYNNHVYVSNKDSDPVDVDYRLVNEYLVDSETDPDDLSHYKFSTTGDISATTQKVVPLEKLPNYTELMLKNGVVYHDDNKHIYRIIGHHELIRLERYDNFNSMSIIYTYMGPENKQLVNKIKLKNLSKQYDPMSLKDYKEEYGQRDLKEHYIYLFKGKNIVAQMPYGDNTRTMTLDYDTIKELLDKTK